LEIVQNQSLAHVDLPVLSRIDARLKLNENPNLASFSFPELLLIGSGEVVDNPFLPTCAVEALKDTTWNPGGGASAWTIAGNDDEALCSQ
jgi:hypothetical protein